MTRDKPVELREAFVSGRGAAGGHWGFVTVEVLNQGEVLSRFFQPDRRNKRGNLRAPFQCRIPQALKCCPSPNTHHQPFKVCALKCSILLKTGDLSVGSLRVAVKEQTPRLTLVWRLAGAPPRLTASEGRRQWRCWFERTCALRRDVVSFLQFTPREWKSVIFFFFFLRLQIVMLKPRAPKICKLVLPGIYVCLSRKCTYRTKLLPRKVKIILSVQQDCDCARNSSDAWCKGW